MQKYIGSDVTSMVTFPVVMFEPMTMLQKMPEVCAASIGNTNSLCSSIRSLKYVLPYKMCNAFNSWWNTATCWIKTDECEDPYLRLIDAAKNVDCFIGAAENSWHGSSSLLCLKKPTSSLAHSFQPKSKIFVSFLWWHATIHVLISATKFGFW